MRGEEIGGEELRDGEPTGEADGDLSEAVHSLGRLLSHRIDLLKLELEQAVRGNARALALSVVAAAMVSLGWIGLMIAGAALLHLALPLWAAVGILSAAHLVGGATAAGIGVKQRHRPALRVGDEERKRALAALGPSSEGAKRLTNGGRAAKSGREDEDRWIEATQSSAS